MSKLGGEIKNGKKEKKDKKKSVRFSDSSDH